MKVTDLRIGDVVDAGNGYAAIVRWLCHDGNIITTGGSGHISEFEPMCMSDMWHKKLNPDMKLYTFIEDDYYYRITILSDESDWCINKELLKFVHQWQNIYHAITAEELTINENELNN